MTDLVTWLRQQLDADEAWARAACQAYPYAVDPALPEGGVHWRWVAGEQWETVVPDPVVNEFVVEPGWLCHLATVEEWQTSQPDQPMPRTYDTEIVEMDACAAGHIVRHDPARVLAEVAAKRAILDEIFRYEEKIDSEWGCCHTAEQIAAGLCRDTNLNGIPALRLLALPYASNPGYDESWRPA